MTSEISEKRRRQREARKASATPSPFTDCLQCNGRGDLPARESGHWARAPHRYEPNERVTCPVCGGTGAMPRAGTFSEEC